VEFMDWSIIFILLLLCTWTPVYGFLTVILSHIHISLMFCHYISCIYSYRLWNILTVILFHIHISLTLSLHILYVQLQTVKYINCNIVPYLYFPQVLSLRTLFIQLRTQSPISRFMKCAKYAWLRLLFYKELMFILF
jgi:hypothetical protein